MLNKKYAIPSPGLIPKGKPRETLAWLVWHFDKGLVKKAYHDRIYKYRLDLEAR